MCISFFLSLSPFFFLPLVLSSAFARDASSLSSEFSLPRSLLPFMRNCFYIFSTMCFDVHVTPLAFLHICVTVITITYSFSPRQINCAIFLLLLIGIPYLTSHNTISSMSFCGFFLLFNRSLLNASSSSASAMESSGLYSSHISSHNFYPIPIGNCLSAFFCRFTLFNKLTATATCSH